MPSIMSKKAAFLYMTALSLTACNQPQPIKLNPPPPPASWLVCEPMPDRPQLAPPVPVPLSDGRVVYLKPETDARDAEIARYILRSREAYFSCWNNLAKVKDYYAGQE